MIAHPRRLAWGVCASAGLLLASGLFFACTAGQASDRRQIEQYQRERSVGRAVAARLARQYGVLRAPEFTAYLNALAAGVARISARPEVEYRAAVLNTNEINVYAAPGGYILFTRGAIFAMESEAELVAVLAHEIAHIALGHAGEFRADASWLELFGGALGGGGFLNSAIDSSAKELHQMLLERGRQKQFELDADSAGALYASTLGYDPRALAAYLQRAAARPGAETLTRTHPPAGERARALLEFADANQLPGARVERERFLRARAALTR
jgi:beta-barrel assembly-enhancing protease